MATILSKKGGKSFISTTYLAIEQCNFIDLSIRSKEITFQINAQTLIENFDTTASVFDLMHTNLPKQGNIFGAKMQ